MKALLKNQITRNLITIHQNTNVFEAQQLMRNHWIRHLPVLDDKNEKVLGLISDRDLLRATGADQSVKELMSAPVKSFEIETPIKTIVHSMIEAKVSAFIITRKSQVVGIVTTEDMLLLLSQFLTESNNTELVLAEFLTNPLFQQTSNMLGNVGI